MAAETPDTQALQRALGALARARADDADLFLEERIAESVSLEEGRVKHVTRTAARGASARIVVGDAVGLAATDRWEPGALLEAAGAARAIAARGDTRAVRLHAEAPPRALYPADDPMADFEIGLRRKLLEEVDREARARDPRVVQVTWPLCLSFRWGDRS